MKMKMTASRSLVLAAALLCIVPRGAVAGDDACAALKQYKLQGGAVDAVEMLAPPATFDIGFQGLPPLPVTATFCRVQAHLTPTPASHIRIEVWLPPADAWNGKFVGTGNAGFGGNFTSPYLFMRGAVAKGYAAAGTDTGHAGNVMGEPPSADWALNQPEKIKDYGYRAEHLTAIAGKALAQAYYRHAPKRAYFQGCSNGGREALMEAQRFPDDYDGIIAGAPANDWVGLATGFAWNTLAAHKTPEGALTTGKLAILQAAALKQCDRLDGVDDGVLEDPRQCKFDPASVACADGKDGDTCLNAAQVETARKIYGGPKNPRTGASLFPGFAVGSEAVQWGQWITGPATDQGAFATGFFRNMVFSDPDWQLSQLDFDRDIDKARKVAGPLLDSDDPDIGAFAKRGGRLLMYQGWADAAIPPQNTINYYEAVRQKIGAAQTDRSVRFFMAPGMAHCLGGPGPNDFDTLAALDHWIESGKAPDRLTAAKYETEYADLLGLPKGEPQRTRPLCPYPQTAHYKGSGSTDDADNFVCRK
jgi:feruloyl esterase